MFHQILDPNWYKCILQKKFVLLASIVLRFTLGYYVAIYDKMESYHPMIN
jgi:hypothetical protein